LIPKTIDLNLFAQTGRWPSSHPYKFAKLPYYAETLSPIFIQALLKVGFWRQNKLRETD